MSSVPQRLLPLLLLASGFCGISYEILYTKLLGNLLGNQFIISASVLLTFLFGIGLGTLFAHRFVGRLWLIEAGIGLYAAAMVAAYGWVERLIYSGIPQVGTNIYSCAAVSIVLLVVPAFLVGCSVPLFAAYLGTLRAGRVFAVTYAIYNLGAALTALTLEFGLLRSVGLNRATLLLAAVNIAVALGLLFLVRTTPAVPPPRHDRIVFAQRDLAALMLASVASAVFQLMMIKVAECIFGPFNETFSLVLATVLLGLALGSALVSRVDLGFGAALLLAVCGLTALLALLPQAVRVYAALYETVVGSYPLLVLLKFALVTVLMGAPAVGFGATIPALLRTHRDVAREAGLLLFLSSMANVVGFLLMAFVLHRLLDYGPLLLLLAATTTAALLIQAGLRRQAWIGLAFVLLAFAALRGLWSESLLYVGHTSFHSTKELESARGEHFLADRYKDRQDVFAIVHKDDGPYFFINGYISIALNTVTEKLVGSLSAMASPRTDNALVLGVGSGATAGTVGLIFDHTDAVEINQVVLDKLHLMERYSFGIESMSGVQLFHDDGIHFVNSTHKRYSLILNTVTSPLYFSSSKLYTRDFFESVRGALTPDGVYATWVDRKIGDRGVDIILETLSTTFDRCWMSYLRASYFLLTCSNGEMALDQVDAVSANRELRNYLMREFALLSSKQAYSILTVDALALRAEGGAPINTLDFPVLEHEMARLGHGGTGLAEFKRRLQQRIDLRAVGRELGRKMDWQPGDFALWAEIRLPADSDLLAVFRQALEREYGEIAPDVERAAVAWADEARAPYASLKYGYELFLLGHYAGAMRLLDRALDQQASLYQAHYYLGRCHEQLGQMELAREEYEAALRIRPDYARAIEALRQLGTQEGATRGSVADDEGDGDGGR